MLWCLHFVLSHFFTLNFILSKQNKVPEVYSILQVSNGVIVYPADKYYILGMTSDVHILPKLTPRAYDITQHKR